MSPFSRGSRFVCTFCRYSSSTSKLGTKKDARILPNASRLQTQVSTETPNLSRTQKLKKPTTTSEPSKPSRLSFAAKYRARFAWMKPSFFRNHPVLRSWLLKILAIAPITGFLLLHFPVEPMAINGPSMSPTINPNSVHYGDYDGDGYGDRDWALVQKWSPNDWRIRWRQRMQLIEHGKYRRGQIVVFTTPHDPEKIAVKRIVGIPGDRVLPLRGYQNGNVDEDPEPVVVQYNHLWVEGDVNDRNKSIDSNWYGPISESLVIGEVIALWRPWWKFWNMVVVDRKKYKWPAKRMGRVEERAVMTASMNPDALEANDSWTNGKNEKVLKLILERPDFVLKNYHNSEKQRALYRNFYFQARQTAQGSADQEKKILSTKIIKAMENLFGVDSLVKGRTMIKKEDGSDTKRERWRPSKEIEDQMIDDDTNSILSFKGAKMHENEGAKKRDERQKPAKAALKKMMEQNRYLANQKDQEIENRDQEREVREGLAASWSLQGLMRGDDEKSEKT